MHLLLITRYYPPIMDGVGDHSYQLKKSLEARGWRVHICTVAGPLDEVQPGVLQVPAFNRYLLPVLLSAIASLSITHVLWQYVPNSFHRRALPLYLPRLLQAVRATGVKQVVFFHEVALRQHGYGCRQWWKGRQQLRLARQLQALATHSITSIPLYAGYLRPAPQVVCIGPNILPAVPSPPPPNGTRLFFCFANRLTEKVLLAFQCWQLEQPVHLLVAGKCDPATTRRIQQWIQRHQLSAAVTLKGALPAPQLAECLQQASVVLQPEPLYHHRQGGISAKNGTLAAAWAAGKLVIATEGDMTDTRIFRHGHNCLLVQQNEVANWQEAIGAALAMSHHDSRLLQQAVQTDFERYFSWATIGQQIHQILTH